MLKKVDKEALKKIKRGISWASLIKIIGLEINPKGGSYS